MINKFDIFLKGLGIKVNNIEHFLEAFTHKTFSNENNYKKNYQRLEFLGDSLLYEITTIHIYKYFDTANEGKMTTIRTSFINGSYLAKLGLKLGFDNHIRRGSSKDLKKNLKIIEDVFEALLAAIYIDSGYSEVYNFVNKFILSDINNVNADNDQLKNPKTILQEYLQSESRANIEYKITKIKNKFLAKVYNDNLFFGEGTGRTKKEAEINAAKNALSLKGGKDEIN